MQPELKLADAAGRDAAAPGLLSRVSSLAAVAGGMLTSSPPVIMEEPSRGPRITSQASPNSPGSVILNHRDARARRASPPTGDPHRFRQTAGSTRAEARSRARPRALRYPAPRGEATRARILEILSRGPHHQQAIARALGMNPRSVDHHLRTLAQQGLINGRALRSHARAPREWTLTPTAHEHLHRLEGRV